MSTIRGLRPELNINLSDIKSDILPIFLTAFSGYIILGGIWEGKTASFENLNPFVVYLIVTAAILLIGGLEGLQISVSSLYRKDLEEVKEYYPRAYEVHKRFKMDEATVQQFFAGRQLLIVAIVFITSRFTAFPTMSKFPLTNVKIPAILDPWFHVIFLSFGLLGALFVYWFGNLTSQLIATEYPVAFLNIPGMSSLLSVCLFIDNIRLPRTSKILASKLAPLIGPDWGTDYPDRIPLSAEQKYRRELESDSGFVISSIAQVWQFGEEELKIQYEVKYKIGREGISTIRDNNFSLPTSVSPKDLDFTPELDRDRSEIDPGYLSSSMTDQNIGGYKEFTLSATDPIGEFEIGDIITFQLSISVETVPSNYESDRLRIDHPAKKLQLYVEFNENNYIIDTPNLNIFNPVHAQTEGTNPAEATSLELTNPDNENVFAEYSEEYPKQGSIYELEWNISSRI